MVISIPNGGADLFRSVSQPCATKRADLGFHWFHFFGLSWEQQTVLFKPFEHHLPFRICISSDRKVFRNLQSLVGGLEGISRQPLADPVGYLCHLDVIRVRLASYFAAACSPESPGCSCAVT